LPLQFNRQRSDEFIKKLTGAGDAALLFNHQVFNKSSKNNNLSHIIAIGGGVKLPTGNYHYDENDETKEVTNANFQPGTGSTDIFLIAAHVMRYKTWAFTSSAATKTNTQNKNGYRFRNVFEFGLTTIYRKELKNIAISS